MTPTMKLRFLKREIETRTATVLQQWFEEPWLGIYMGEDGPIDIGGKGEWRDIPIEEIGD